MARYLIAGVMLFDDELYEVSGVGGVVQAVVSVALFRPWCWEPQPVVVSQHYLRPRAP